MIHRLANITLIDTLQFAMGPILVRVFYSFAMGPITVTYAMGSLKPSQVFSLLTVAPGTQFIQLNCMSQFRLMSQDYSMDFA